MKFVVLILLFMPLFASAGIFEIGASASYSRSQFTDKNNFQETNRYSGSVSYYFMEMSALEFNYTFGRSTISTKQGVEATQKVQTKFQMYGVDLVFSFAGRKSDFQPYVKLGVAYLDKEIFREVEGLGTTQLPGLEGIVPTAGLGFKIRLSERFSVKVGIDAWTDPIDNDDSDSANIDYAFRGGFSWYL